ncbi:MAG: hypothetical protein ACYTCU_01160 [Planctomycetota bacterium]|jgi:hypothetical protein
MTTSRDTLGCGTALADLHRWFDGELLDEEIARHVRDCELCTAELERIEGQRDALASLSGVPQGVEAALASSRRAAEAALADLLAELVGCCLPAPGEGPSRAWSTVRAEVALMAARLAQLGGTLDTAALPDRAPGPDEGAAFARRIVAVLAALEGPTARSRALSERCGLREDEA